ncbi:MAG: hypothetical protein CVU39_25150 [Chloroflexi bacterium HGW-Chloroflexi-10]|nr:MAG: hypothetical protein CVU39_25150 [Chloroflexi bacterium HGW-Chloroflexi-10]
MIISLLYPSWDQDSIPAEVSVITDKTIEQSRILDLGCGTGTHSLYLTSKGYQVTGIDLSAKAIETAKEKAQSNNVAVIFFGWRCNQPWEYYPRY